MANATRPKQWNTLEERLARFLSTLEGKTFSDVAAAVESFAEGTYEYTINFDSNTHYVPTTLTGKKTEVQANGATSSVVIRRLNLGLDGENREKSKPGYSYSHNLSIDPKHILFQIDAGYTNAELENLTERIYRFVIDKPESPETPAITADNINQILQLERTDKTSDKPNTVLYIKPLPLTAARTAVKNAIFGERSAVVGEELSGKSEGEILRIITENASAAHTEFAEAETPNPLPTETKTEKETKFVPKKEYYEALIELHEAQGFFAKYAPIDDQFYSAYDIKIIEHKISVLASEGLIISDDEAHEQLSAVHSEAEITSMNNDTVNYAKTYSLNNADYHNSVAAYYKTLTPEEDEYVTESELLAVLKQSDNINQQCRELNLYKKAAEESITTQTTETAEFMDNNDNPVLTQDGDIIYDENDIPDYYDDGEIDYVTAAEYVELMINYHQLQGDRHRLMVITENPDATVPRELLIEVECKHEALIEGIILNEEEVIEAKADKISAEGYVNDQVSLKIYNMATSDYNYELVEYYKNISYNEEEPIAASSYKILLERCESLQSEVNNLRESAQAIEMFTDRPPDPEMTAFLRRLNEAPIQTGSEIMEAFRARYAAHRSPEDETEENTESSRTTFGTINPEEEIPMSRTTDETNEGIIIPDVLPLETYTSETRGTVRPKVKNGRPPQNENGNTRWQRFKTWVKDNGKKLIIAGITVVVVAAIALSSIFITKSCQTKNSLNQTDSAYTDTMPDEEGNDIIIPDVPNQDIEKNETLPDEVTPDEVAPGGGNSGESDKGRNKDRDTNFAEETAALINNTVAKGTDAKINIIEFESSQDTN